jgi:hypothetical protein
MEKLKTSTEEIILFNDLNLTENICKYCLFIKDTRSEFTTITKGKKQHYFCSNCNNYYCINCLAKETIIKAKNYPYCFRCMRRQKKLLQEPKVEESILCMIDRCPQNACYESLFYNAKTDKIMFGNFCKQHYHSYYYYIKQKTSKLNRVSYGKKKQTRKPIIKTRLFSNRNGRTKEFQESVNSL